MKVVISKFIFLSIVSIMLFLSGCGSSGSGVAANNSTTVSLKAGELRLSKMNGMAKVSAAVQGQISSATTFGNMSSATSFNLGTIKASQSYYFMLSNTGDIPVTDVVITSSNGNFVVSPNSFDKINPQKENLIIPIVKVNITHGVTLNGAGYSTSLLPMGDSTCTINIKGKTKDQNNNVINIDTNIKLNIYAELVDLQLTDDNYIMDLTKPTWFNSQFESYIIYDYRCKKPIITNTGNVDLTITNMTSTWALTADPPVIEQFTLSPNQSKTLNYPQYYVNNGWVMKCVYLKIEGGNTITNYQKLKLQSDGNVYLRINNFNGDGTTLDYYGSNYTGL